MSPRPRACRGPAPGSPRGRGVVTAARTGGATVEELAPRELDLTPRRIDRAKAARGENPLAEQAGGPEHGPEGPLRRVRNGCAAGWRSMRRRHGGTGLHSLSTCGNEATAGSRELFPRCASCGNAGSGQGVALRLKINQQRGLDSRLHQTNKQIHQ